MSPSELVGADDLRIEERYVDNGEGWLLRLICTHAPSALRPERRPVLILPGYGMNTFVLGYHPRGTSMVHHLARKGFEVWAVEMRHQGRSIRRRLRPAPPSMLAYARVDLPAIIDTVRQATRTSTDRVDFVGASLGGTIGYAHLALCPDHHIGSVVAIGAPLMWPELHPLVWLAFRSRRLAGAIPFWGTRTLARVAFPLLLRVPGALHLYVNPAHVDPADAPEFTNSVDDPHPRLNRDIADWVQRRDLVLDGVVVSEALVRETGPLLVILANGDGIVPPSSATSALEVWGGQDKEVLEVGTEEDWYAHADLFISPAAPELVFEPMADWLGTRNAS